MNTVLKFAGLFALLAISPVAFAAANISIQGLLNFVIWVVILGVIFWVIWWFIGYVGVPEPFNKVLRVVIGLVALIIVINLLLGLAGSPLFTFN